VGLLLLLHLLAVHVSFHLLAFAILLHIAVHVARHDLLLVLFIGLHFFLLQRLLVYLLFFNDLVSGREFFHLLVHVLSAGSVLLCHFLFSGRGLLDGGRFLLDLLSIIYGRLFLITHLSACFILN